MNWMILPYRRYFEFSGRSRRKEYWGFVLFTWLVSMVLNAVFGVSTYHMMSGVLASGAMVNTTGSLPGNLFALASFIPSFAVTVRRLHDQNRTGWWLLLVFLPILGWFALLVMSASTGPGGPTTMARTRRTRPT